MDASLKIFRLTAGGDASLDIEELESWLRLLASTVPEMAIEGRMRAAGRTSPR